MACLIRLLATRGSPALSLFAMGAACDDGGLLRIEADFALEASGSPHVNLLGTTSQVFITVQHLERVPLRVDLSPSVPAPTLPYVPV